MIFVFSAKPQPNQKNMAMRHSDTLKIEAWSAQNNLPGHQNDSLRVQDEAQEWQDRPWDCPNACQDRPWQPNLLLEVLPNANFGVPGSLWDWFWRPQESYLRGSSINFEPKISFHSMLHQPSSLTLQTLWSVVLSSIVCFFVCSSATSVSRGFGWYWCIR